jgi:uncharacterized peroxidase-related enzyme
MESRDRGSHAAVHGTSAMYSSEREALCMTTFTVPTRDDVSTANQQHFDTLQKGLGMVPNLYAMLAHNETALGDYLTLQNRRSTLRAKEREVINLAVSEVNGCQYCLAAHTAIGTMVGFAEEQILEIRSGHASFDPRLHALAAFVRETTLTRGHPDPRYTDALLTAGFSTANLIDVIIVIGDKMITNFLHGVTQIPIDFPLAPSLASAR